MRSQGKRTGILEFSEKTAERVEPRWAGTAGLPHQGQLPARLRPGTHRGGLSRGHLVSLLHPRSAGKNHPGTPHWGQNRRKRRFCPKSSYIIFTFSRNETARHSV